MSQLATKMPSTSRRTTAQSPRVPTATISHEAIARLAYQNWQKRGCPIGDDQRDWLTAEAELTAEQASHRRSR